MNEKSNFPYIQDKIYKMPLVLASGPNFQPSTSPTLEAIALTRSPGAKIYWYQGNLNPKQERSNSK